LTIKDPLTPPTVQLWSFWMVNLPELVNTPVEVMRPSPVQVMVPELVTGPEAIVLVAGPKMVVL
jgi:hypothetical protein